VTIVALAGLLENADPERDGRKNHCRNGDTANATLFFKMRGNDDLDRGAKRRLHQMGRSSLQRPDGKPDRRKWQRVRRKCQLRRPADDWRPPIKLDSARSWTEVPPSSMRYASFSAPTEDGGKIDISVVTFPGDGEAMPTTSIGGRGQMGLAPVDATL